MGWCPTLAVTFLENHDTGSTQRHWVFPHHGLEQGYAYILVSSAALLLLRGPGSCLASRGCGRTGRAASVPNRSCGPRSS